MNFNTSFASCTSFCYIYIYGISFLYRVLPVLFQHTLSSHLWRYESKTHSRPMSPRTSHRKLWLPVNLYRKTCPWLYSWWNRHDIAKSLFLWVNKGSDLTFALLLARHRGDTGNAGTFIRTVSPALNCIGQVMLIICVPIKTSKTCPGTACGGNVRWTTALKQEVGCGSCVSLLGSIRCILMIVIWSFYLDYEKGVLKIYFTVPMPSMTGGQQQL